MGSGNCQTVSLYSNRELEKTLTELRNTQLALAEAEKKRDEFKGRAQETVRQ